MRILNFSVAISEQEMFAIYSGAIKNVIVVTDSGLRVQVRGDHFKAFVTRDGVRGRFRMILDDNNRLVKLEKL
ncbi:MAG: DUF2835 family protein [Ruminobacter sp.]|nr:DUF2835 family protein [Ruminobacter sp.]